MKIAVIFGVGHMMMGLAQKGINARYFGDKIDFWHEFVPQTILLLSLFGYMDLMIIQKWLQNYQGYEKEAPGIISIMTGMFLEGGKITGKELFYGHVLINNVLAGKLLLSNHICSYHHSLCPLDASRETISTAQGVQSKVQEEHASRRRRNARTTIPGIC
jgi:vacuolar-type H+-ATPase subunit I/STV1